MLKQFIADPNHLFTLEDVTAMSSDEKEELKWLCCTDLFFLANNICRSPNPKYKPLIKKVHGSICDTLAGVLSDEGWRPITAISPMGRPCELHSVVPR